MIGNLRKRLGQAKAESLIEKHVGRFVAFCQKHGLWGGVAVIDPDDETPPSQWTASRMFGPHAGAGIACATSLLDRSLANIPPDKFVQTMNDIRAFLDQEERDYWQALEWGGISFDDEGNPTGTEP